RRVLPRVPPASEADAAPGPAGVMTPAAMPLWTVRMMFPRMFVRMCEIVQLLGAGGLVAVPSYAELEGPAAADVTTYFQAANADAKTRIKLFRLAFDAAVSSFSGRQQLYERYYSGDPVRLAGALYALYDKDTHIDRIIGMLDDIEAHHPPPIAAQWGRGPTTPSAQSSPHARRARGARAPSHPLPRQRTLAGGEGRVRGADEP